MSGWEFSFSLEDDPCAMKLVLVLSQVKKKQPTLETERVLGSGRYLS